MSLPEKFNSSNFSPEQNKQPNTDLRIIKEIVEEDGTVKKLFSDPEGFICKTEIIQTNGTMLQRFNNQEGHTIKLIRTTPMPKNYSLEQYYIPDPENEGKFIESEYYIKDAGGKIMEYENLLDI
ncbi:MAG: hypothetical protein PHS07_00875 [Patescibacteria group bacterium]|jgi:hypothetical protein|nr:hypothetical protein [Patescibacteria group bacterium]